MSELDEVIEAGKRLNLPLRFLLEPPGCSVIGWIHDANDEELACCGACCSEREGMDIALLANTADKLAEFAKIFAPKLEAVMPCDTDNYGGCDIHLSMPEFLRARELLALFIHGGKDEHD